MRYITKQLIGILAPAAAAWGLWSLITSGWGEGAAAKISDLTVRFLTEMLMAPENFGS